MGCILRHGHWYDTAVLTTFYLFFSLFTVVALSISLKLIPPLSPSSFSYFLFSALFLLLPLFIDFSELDLTSMQCHIFGSLTRGIGILMFGYLFGSLASLISNTTQRQASFSHMHHKLSLFLSSSGVQEKSRVRVMSYLSHLWARHRGRTTDELFHRLPSSLQGQIAYARLADSLRHVPSLSGLDPPIIKAACMRSKLLVLLPGDSNVSLFAFFHPPSFSVPSIYLF